MIEISMSQESTLNKHTLGGGLMARKKRNRDNREMLRSPRRAGSIKTEAKREREEERDSRGGKKGHCTNIEREREGRDKDTG